MKFHTIYESLLKASSTTLRERDKKREKRRAEQTARRRPSPKRCNGRKKRQRQIMAALKLEATKERAVKETRTE
ncbi:hypothetical protein EDC04DRAFT_2723580, partial [Pisolithus marmoratus]